MLTYKVIMLSFITFCAPELLYLQNPLNTRTIVSLYGHCVIHCTKAMLYTTTVLPISCKMRYAVYESLGQKYFVIIAGLAHNAFSCITFCSNMVVKQRNFSVALVSSIVSTRVNCLMQSIA